MKRFLKQLGLFAAIQLLILIAVIIRYPGQDNTFLAATIDKHRFASNRPPPRLFLVGGSNVAFGYISPEIEKALGVRPVNMGLHIGLGLDFVLSEISDLMRDGDTLILSLEYAHFAGDTTDLVVPQLIEFRPASLSYISANQSKVLLDSGFVYLLQIIRKAIRGEVARDDRPGYSREAFNKYGDVVGHHGHSSVPIAIHTSTREYNRREILRATGAICRFAEAARRRGVRVYFDFPAIPEAKYAAMAGTIAEIHRALENCDAVELLGSPEEKAYPIELFYDTPYHLTLSGKNRRTRLLIERLRSANPFERND